MLLHPFVEGGHQRAQRTSPVGEVVFDPRRRFGEIASFHSTRPAFSLIHRAQRLGPGVRSGKSATLSQGNLLPAEAKSRVEIWLCCKLRLSALAFRPELLPIAQIDLPRNQITPDKVQKIFSQTNSDRDGRGFPVGMVYWKDYWLSAGKHSFLAGVPAVCVSPWRCARWDKNQLDQRPPRCPDILHRIARPLFQAEQGVRPTKRRPPGSQDPAKGPGDIHAVDGKMMKPDRTDPLAASIRSLHLKELNIGAVAKADDAGCDDTSIVFQCDRCSQVLSRSMGPATGYRVVDDSRVERIVKKAGGGLNIRHRDPDMIDPAHDPGIGDTAGHGRARNEAINGLSAAAHSSGTQCPQLGSTWDSTFAA